MNTLEYLEAVKKRLGIESDYALAKVLKMRASTISNYRSGRGQMDDEIAVKVAEVLGLHPGVVVLDMHRERAKTPAAKSLWKEIAEGFLSLVVPANVGKGFAPA